MKDNSRLRITEIFYSIQGESSTIGFPTVFIRLTGCPLRCVYCDTAYAFQGGEWKTSEEIVNDVAQYNTQYVTVTGGEPLAQKNCLPLLSRLCDAGFSVSLETSGAIDISGVDRRVKIVMDLKTPGSGEIERNLYTNLPKLKSSDEIKFVITSRSDYEWSKSIIEKEQLAARCQVIVSPAFGEVTPTELAEWVLEDQLPVRFQVQLHKILWGDAQGK